MPRKLCSQAHKFFEAFILCCLVACKSRSDEEYKQYNTHIVFCSKTRPRMWGEACDAPSAILLDETVLCGSWLVS